MIQYYETDLGRFGTLKDVYTCMRLERKQNVVILQAIDWKFENLEGVCGSYTIDEMKKAVEEDL